MFHHRSGKLKQKNKVGRCFMVWDGRADLTDRTRIMP